MTEVLRRKLVDGKIVNNYKKLINIYICTKKYFANITFTLSDV